MPNKHAQQKELIEAIKINVAPRQTGAPLNKKHFIKAVLVLAVLILVVLLWFVISAKTVILEISPPADAIELSGGSLAIEFRERYLAQPGEYQLTASRQGYYPLSETLKIGRLPNYTFKRVLRKKPGKVTINAQVPQRARVYVNNHYVGVTPIENLALTPGKHTVELQRYRYQKLWSELQVEGAGKEQTFSFSMLPDWSLVSIDSQPSNAQLWLNGEQLAHTPAKLELDAGTHHMEIIHPDFSAHISDFVVLPNQALDLGVIRLDRDPSRIVMKSQPVGARVLVNSKQLGVTPFTFSATPNTEYRLQFEKPGYRSLSRRVTVAASESKTIAVSLKPILATLHLDVEPASAVVIVDGESRGKGKQVLSLTTAEHEIEVMESGYQTQVLTLIPKLGEPVYKKIVLALNKKSSAHIPSTIKSGEGQQLRLITPAKVAMGEFTMGASRREQGRRANEVLRKVKLTRQFYVATQEVTNAEFSRFDPKHSSGSYSGVNLSASTLPVTNISWDQAAHYCNWLSRKENLPVMYREQAGVLVAPDMHLPGYRLVTEAEWSWLARVQSNGSTLRYAWGDAYPPQSLNGNYADSNASQIIGLVIENRDDGFAGPAPVASFAANRHGIYDIDANVAEWVHDYYTIFAVSGARLALDPVGPDQGKHHVIRGASWLRGTLSNTRLAYREYRAQPRVDVGFRIARYVKE